jgi:hypothetical protein
MQQSHANSPAGQQDSKGDRTEVTRRKRVGALIRAADGAFVPPTRVHHDPT